MAKKRKKTDFSEQRERIRRARELVERELKKLEAQRRLDDGETTAR